MRREEMRRAEPRGNEIRHNMTPPCDIVLSHFVSFRAALVVYFLSSCLVSYHHTHGIRQETERPDTRHHTHIHTRRDDTTSQTTSHCTRGAVPSPLIPYGVLSRLVLYSLQCGVVVCHAVGVSSLCLSRWLSLFLSHCLSLYFCRPAPESTLVS